MDQPTTLNITITGTEPDVIRAAVAAKRRIDKHSVDLNEEDYSFDESLDFEKLEQGIYENAYTFSHERREDGTVSLDTEMSDYDCIEENDVREIADEIVKAAPEVEFGISAVITITFAEGYDLCVDIDYTDGQMKVETSEEYYEGFDDDEEDDEDEDDEE